MRRITKTLVSSLFSILTISLIACVQQVPVKQPPPLVPGNSESTYLQGEARQDKFWSMLKDHCGKSFIGKSTYPSNIDDSFYNKELIADVATCTESEIQVPFIVGENKSRTWIFTRTNGGIQLKHRHLHDDGTLDEISNYGGLADTNSPTYKNSTNESISLSFPADSFTQNLIPAAATNIWTITLTSGEATQNTSLSYDLSRHGKPRFNAVLHLVNDNN